MEISQIPKAFWYALSFAVILLSVGFTVTAYRSSSISIEIANTKIGLSKAASLTKSANEDLISYLRDLEKKRVELENLQVQLIAAVNKLEAGSSGSSVRLGDFSKYTEAPVPKLEPERLDRIKTEIKKSQDSIQQLQPVLKK